MINDSAQESTGKIIETWDNTKDGSPMYSKTWKAVSEPPIATVVFIHGFGEHINRYNYVFSKFSKKNIEVYSYDQRGFGQTAKWNNNRGYISGWDVALNDITEALIVQRRPGIPQFLMGHSMGGSLALCYASEGLERDNLAGFVISAPLITLTKSQPLVNKLGHFFSNIVPNCPIPINLNPKVLCHDPEVHDQYRNDPLRIKVCSLKAIATILKESKFLLESKYKNINSPIYFCHGSDDQLTSQKSSQELFDKIPSKDKTYHKWDGLYHEIHNEFKKDEVIDDYLEWIIAHVNKK